METDFILLLTLGQYNQTEFRSTVKEAFPVTENILQYFPASPPRPAEKGNELQSADVESVPKILLRIEEANPNTDDAGALTASSDRIGKTSATDDVELESLTPSERAAAKARSEDSVQGDTRFSNDAIEKAAEADIKPADPQHIIDLEIIGKDVGSSNSETVSEPSSDNRNKEMEVTRSEVTEDTDLKSLEGMAQLGSIEFKEEGDRDLKVSRSDSFNAISGKSKLARLLGKPEFDAGKLQGREVIDNSIFGKPKLWLTEESDIAQNQGQNQNPDEKDSQSGTKKDSRLEKEEKPKTKQVPAEEEARIPEEYMPLNTEGSKTNEDERVTVPEEYAPLKTEDTKTNKNEKSSASMPVKSLTKTESDHHIEHTEVEALRAELASQNKWEAIRLQEAVRSQLIEDKKTAAREIATLKHQHAEEIARVREEAATQTQKLVEEKVREVSSQHKENREKEVKRMMRERETELREELVVEFTEREAENSHTRESALTKAEAKVKALSKRFDAVVAHTERAKEATQRASGAFVLHEAMKSGEGLSVALEVASRQSELGALVAQSVPEAIVQDGIKSLDRLREDFVLASQRGLSVATVPEEKSGSIWAHALASAFSRLKLNVDIRSDGVSEPDSNEERIRLAQYYVREGNLRAAVRTLDRVDGLAADVLKDWLHAAKSRIAVSMAADVLLADAIISQATLMKAE